VPAHLKEYALRALRPSLFREDMGISGLRPSRGQMMGSYLSFPLLCIQNRLAFLYAFSRSMPLRDCEKVPCLINGDDILFQSEKGFSDDWMNVVGRLGLEVEKTKTSVDAGFGTLNSTLLRWRGVHLRVIPTLRFGRLRSVEHVNSLAAGFEDWLKGVSSNVRFRAGMVWFKRFLPLLRSTRLTLLELGFRGRLAHRLSVLFRLDSCLVEYSPPAPPVGHNCVPRELTTVKLEEDCSPEVLLANDRETAAWKFSLHFREWHRRSKILYVLRLSAIRSRPQPDFRTALVRSWVSPASSLPLFLKPRQPKKKARFIFDTLLMQRDEGPPPPYDFGLESRPFGDHDVRSESGKKGVWW